TTRGRSQAEGTSIALDPGPVADGIVGARLVARVDARNRNLDDAVLERDPSADGNLAEVVRMALGHLRVALPEGAVRPGHTWSGPEVVLDARRVGGWVLVRARPTFRLAGVEGRFAIVEWGGALRSEPFCQLGPCLVAVGVIGGRS